MAWRDPLLPQVNIPLDEELKKSFYSLGNAVFQLMPKQFEFIFAPEQFVAFMGGFGSSKTRSGVYKAALLSMVPYNRGIVGRFASTDLEDTTQRDLIEFLGSAQLIKDPLNVRTKRMTVHCVDPKTNQPLGAHSEISFQHLDDPAHLRSRHVGWFWIDEASEVDSHAFLNLVGRLRHTAAQNHFKGFVTGNPEGHNWIYDFFFNSELLEKLPEETRQQRRGIHATSFENYFLPKEYIELQLSSFPPEWREKYLEGSFDVFEGQAHSEFSFAAHVLPDSVMDYPPEHWNRLLAVDVGGADPWAWLFLAADMEGNVIVYDEIYKKTTDAAVLVNMAIPKIGNLHFQAKVIDYENKVAADDLHRLGITFTNAQKKGKTATILRVSGYLHPNSKHIFPEWHPRAGQAGSPRLFIHPRCKDLIRELPQQRWRVRKENGRVVNELDPNVDNHSYDALRYAVMELPNTTELKETIMDRISPKLDKRSELYWFNLYEQEAMRKQREGGIYYPRRGWNTVMRGIR